jgi:hypothetical protein
MSSRRRNQSKAHVQPAPASPGVETTTEASEALPILKLLVEEAADLARSELATNGRITPKAVFVYDQASHASRSRIVTVTLSIRSEQQRDALKKRVRDKAAVENARAVVIVHDTDAGQLTIFGATAETRISASISYLFDARNKTVNRWEMQWGTAP